MIEAEWWDYDDAAEQAEAIAGDVGFIVESALDARGQALLALPAGEAEGPALIQLAKAKLDWKKVTITPTGDRLGDVQSSNAAKLAKLFMAKGARVLPIGSDNPDVAAAGRAADARLQDLHWPPDLVWLDVAEGGGTAGLAASPDLAAALDAPKARRAVGLTPDDGSGATVTLTRAAILAARTILISGAGAGGRTLLEGAIADGQSSRLPIGRVLAEADHAVDIHWLDQD